MTAAYAMRAPEEQSQYMRGSRLWLVSSAPAQGQEARKLRENVLAISASTATRGHSVESARLSAAVRDLAECIEALQVLVHSPDDVGSYTHVPLKPAFTVRATYKLSGKLKPRQVPIDE